MGNEGIDALIGASRPMQVLRGRLARLVQCEAHLDEGVMPPVLVTGETGAGKELAARALHFGGTGRERAFVTLNCAAPPPDLRCLGAAESATLFLDEVGEADAALQVKLLELMDERHGSRLGSGLPRRIPARVIAATSHDLQRRVQVGRFRADLYFRLRVVCLPVPTLRERREDIATLADHFLAMHGRRYGKPGLGLAAEAREALLAHSWPGNVRELRNRLEEAVLLADGEVVDAARIAASIRLPRSQAQKRARSAALSRTRVEAAIAQADGNVTRAARILGISRDTLRYRIREHAPRGRSGAAR